MSNPEATAGPAPDKAHVLAEVPLLQNPEIKGKGFGPMYSFMRFVGERSIAHFFRRIMVVGGEDIPQKGTFILCCTHFATLMDVAIISAELPHRRPIHYWAKKGLYKRQPFRWILENSGNIQVDRKEKNNAMLFAGTFQAMEAGEPIGLFPEGGSFTEPRLHAMKAGAAWAALEYAKHLVVRGAAEPGKTNVLIVPATINYTDKSRFRSEAIFEFGQAFTVDQYTEEFLKTVESEDGDGKQASNGASHLSLPSNGLMSGTSGDESNAQRAPLLSAAMIAKRASKAPSNSASARQAVHRLTDRIGEELYKMTIDAPDWTTWHSIKMARELIWKRNGELPLRNLVKISNALVALLNAPIPKAKLANETLCALQGLVCASSTDVHTLNVMARLFSLPRRAMQPSDQQGADFTLPTRKRSERAVPSIVPALLFLLRQIIFLAVRLPYVLPLAIVYAPAYSIGWYLAKKYSSHEEESMSSSKSLCAFVIAGLTHILIIVLVSAPFLFTPVGWILGLGLCILIEKTHVYFLDETYGCVKKLVIAWRMVLASVSLWIGGNHRGQLGSENARVRLAVDVVKSAPGIQWSFVKALRHEAHEAKLSTNRQRSGSFTASEGGQSDAQDSSVIPPNIRPKIFNRSGRPACYRLMGVTRLVHAQAVQALHDLLEEFELLDRQYDAKPSGNNDVDLDTIEKYRYIRQEMQKSGVSVMPRSRRYLIGRRKAQ